MARSVRPHMPGYGITASDDGLLPWSWAVARLEISHDFWVATLCPDGRPHVTPVWGVWAEEALWFSCAPGSRKARNLTADARMTATTDDAHRPVVLDGDAERIDAEDAGVSSFTSATNAKYGTDYSLDFFADNALFRLRPTSAFGLDDADFTGTPTRWLFDDAR
jgi:hypothetical protein